MSKPKGADVVHKQIVIARDQPTTFRLWTEAIHRWWPHQHTLSGDPKTHVVMEGQVGGRVYERASDGEEHEWGRIVAWEPPQRLAFTWYLGSTPTLPTRVEVRFYAVDPQTTRIELEHQGPELIGSLWARRVAIFEKSWGTILERLAAHAPS